MKQAIALLALVLLLSASLAQAERIAQSGSYIVDLDRVERENGEAALVLPTNVLANPGFETGALPPWTTNNWSVTGADAYTGEYCVEDIGNFWVRQDFDPVDVSDINSITLASRQPEASIQAVDLYYSATDFDEFLVFPVAELMVFDVTSELRAVGSLVAIRIWGYSGGGPDPDLTRVDDVVIDAQIPVTASQATWGAVKQLFR
jgi:hypothetical protein